MDAIHAGAHQESDMPSSLTGYRIFIASPGGLQDMREAFRDIIAKYNTEDAMRRGVVFIPVGWELTLGGMGRPQAIINQELEECDAFVLVLHDRWGSNPGGAEGYTSGTQEEYEKAMQYFGAEDKPMRELLIFFKSLEAERLSDPGPQLKQVLDFKKRLEQERSLLFHQIETPGDFQDRFRTFLASWIRDHEKGQKPAELEAPVSAVAAPTARGEPDAADLTPLEKAIAMEKDGRLTEAEAIYAELAAPNNSPQALLQYADFLFRLRRKVQAEAIYRRGLAIAEAAGDPRATAKAQVQLGYALSQKQDFDGAQPLLEAATRVFEEQGLRRDLAEAKLRLGELRAATGNAGAAKTLFETALVDLDAEDDLEVRADLNAALAQGASDRGEFENSARLYQLARELKERSGSRRDLADILVGLGSTVEALERPRDAISIYNESVQLFEREGNIAGQADAFDHLGHAYDAVGETDNALRAYDKAAGLFEAIQKFDSAADAYTSVAKLYAKMGNDAEAASAYRQALPLLGRLKNREEVREIYESLDELLQKPASEAAEE
jgi:tetratricopeptide (TPR) repeat protein